jgi:hypothetical protein
MREFVFAYPTAIRGCTKEGNSVVAPCGLHSGLRQQGVCFSAERYGLAEARPFRFCHSGESALYAGESG